MSYQKPEKDYGEGPVRIPAVYLPLNKTDCLFGWTENPQDPHHTHFSQSSVSGEGLPGADRTCQIQGPACQRPCPLAYQELESHDEEDSVW